MSIFSVVRTINDIEFVCFPQHYRGKYHIVIVFNFMDNACYSFYEYETRIERDFDLLHLEDSWLIDALEDYKLSMN